MASTQWRVYITANNGGGVPGIGEVEMYSTLGGANICMGGTASVSSFYTADYNASKANDGNASTFWDAAGPAPQWWQYAFASAVTVVEFALRAPMSNLGDMPKDFALQYNDGSGWVTARSFTGETAWAAGEIRYYPVTPVARTKWRVNITAIEGGVPGMAELAMFTAEGGPNVCSGGSASVSSFYPFSGSYVGANAFDGNNATFWDANGSTPQWIQYAWRLPQDIFRYAITAPPSGNQANAPKAWAFQYTDASGAWVDADTRTAQPNWAANEKRTYTFGTPGAHSGSGGARPQVFVCT
jgi:hypothetical protein